MFCGVQMVPTLQNYAVTGYAALFSAFEETPISCGFAGSAYDMICRLLTADLAIQAIKNIFVEGELDRNTVAANFATTAADGKIYQVNYYSLDVIISIGYRVKSLRGTQFRIWASSILKEYMKKGFALDDDRLKRLGGENYFDELLAHIRDIRSSEKVFWRKVLEIYATSIDYNPSAKASVLFFKQVQNKMHWAAHKHTAAEIVYQRADAEKENMGLASWEGKQIKRIESIRELEVHTFENKNPTGRPDL